MSVESAVLSVLESHRLYLTATLVPPAAIVLTRALLFVCTLPLVRAAAHSQKFASPRQSIAMAAPTSRGLTGYTDTARTRGRRANGWGWLRVPRAAPLANSAPTRKIG